MDELARYNPLSDAPQAAEDKTVTPVASSADWFEVAAFDALQAGYITTNGYERIIDAHRRRHD